MGLVGNDLISGLRRNPSTRRAFPLLRDAPGPMFDAVAALATVNLRRQEQGFQVLALFYISVIRIERERRPLTSVELR